MLYRVTYKSNRKNAIRHTFMNWTPVLEEARQNAKLLNDKYHVTIVNSKWEDIEVIR